jgi:hypothetical protein
LFWLAFCRLVGRFAAQAGHSDAAVEMTGLNSGGVSSDSDMTCHTINTFYGFTAVLLEDGLTRCHSLLSSLLFGILTRYSFTSPAARRLF